MSTAADNDLALSRARNEAIGLAGMRWVEEKAAELALLATGTYVVIDVETGSYVTGADYFEAMDKYIATLGPGRTGFVHAIGRRIFVGGGLAQG